MIGYVYGHGGKNSSNQDLGIKVSHSVGTFCGQLLFGWVSATPLGATHNQYSHHTTARRPCRP